jgi:hypothetical protein
MTRIHWFIARGPLWLVALSLVVAACSNGGSGGSGY